MKTCTKCKLAKAASSADFPPSKKMRDGLHSHCRQCVAEKGRAWAKKNAQHRLAKERARYAVKGRKTRPDNTVYVRAWRQTPKAFALHRLQTRLSRLLKRNVGCREMLQLVGCTRAELVAHLERQFPDGMTWVRRREWHIDHIKPFAAFNLSDADELRAACHFTNLQPLWAADNIAKGAAMAA